VPPHYGFYQFTEQGLQDLSAAAPAAQTSLDAPTPCEHRFHLTISCAGKFQQRSATAALSAENGPHRFLTKFARRSDREI
jgi:hypothetical protein